MAKHKRRARSGMPLVAGRTRWQPRLRLLQAPKTPDARHAALEARAASDALEADRAALEEERRRMAAGRQAASDALEADRAALEEERRRMAAGRKAAEQRLQAASDALEADRAAFEDERRRMAAGRQASDVLRLSIGGEKTVAVLRGTLCSLENSMLVRMFSGRWDTTLARDEDGAILIDFDPDLFMPLLAILRMRCARGVDAAPPCSRDAVWEILDKADGRRKEFDAMLNYFCIERMDLLAGCGGCLPHVLNFEEGRIEWLEDIPKLFGCEGGILLDTLVIEHAFDELLGNEQWCARHVRYVDSDEEEFEITLNDQVIVGTPGKRITIDDVVKALASIPEDAWGPGRSYFWEGIHFDKSGMPPRVIWGS